MENTLEKQIRTEQRFAEQEQAQDALASYAQVEQSLLQLYANAGSPYGRRRDDAWKWLNERYALWLQRKQQEEKRRQIEVALADTSGNITLDQALEEMLVCGDLMIVNREDGEHGVMLTAFGILKYHTYMCQELLTRVARDMRDLTSSEYEIYEKLLVSAYATMQALKPAYSG